MMKKIIIILMIVFLFGIVSAVKNPSAVYCEGMGYEFIISSTENGDVGMCKLSENTVVNAGNFLKGKIGQEYSYCEKHGYILKTIKDSEKCSSIFSEECAVCIVNNGVGVTGSAIGSESGEIEVTELMGLEFNEATCGDGVCITLEENYGSCPEDCSSGSEDYYCDKIEDGRCDSDCTQGEDPDCPYVIDPEKCIYDGICYPECIGTGDIDCLCLDSESEECKLALVCNKDGICSGDENYQNCPQDCPPDGAEAESAEQSDEQVDWLSYLVKSLIIGLVIVILICFIKISQDKRREKK